MDIKLPEIGLKDDYLKLLTRTHDKPLLQALTRNLIVNNQLHSYKLLDQYVYETYEDGDDSEDGFKAELNPKVPKVKRPEELIPMAVKRQLKQLYFTHVK